MISTSRLTVLPRATALLYAVAFVSLIAVTAAWALSLLFAYGFLQRSYELHIHRMTANLADRDGTFIQRLRVCAVDQGILIYWKYSQSSESMFIGGDYIYLPTGTSMLWGAEAAGFVRVPGSAILDFSITRSQENDYIGTASSYKMTVPLWVVAFVLAVWPLVRLLRRLRRRWHAKQGLCIKCGYDLRATPDRCPECGRSKAVQTGSPCKIAS